MDGTFASCPHQFGQLFIIHVIRNGMQFPIVYYLLQNKDKRAYNELVTNLKTISEENNLHLNPLQIISDFEAASVAAFNGQFPRTAFTGCWFHYRSALWKCVQRHGLVVRYRTCMNGRKFIM